MIFSDYRTGQWLAIQVAFETILLVWSLYAVTSGRFYPAWVRKVVEPYKSYLQSMNRRRPGE